MVVVEEERKIRWDRMVEYWKTGKEKPWNILVDSRIIN